MKMNPVRTARLCMLYLLQGGGPTLSYIPWLAHQLRPAYMNATKPDES